MGSENDAADDDEEEDDDDDNDEFDMALSCHDGEKSIVQDCASAGDTWDSKLCGEMQFCLTKRRSRRSTWISTTAEQRNRGESKNPFCIINMTSDCT